MRKLRYEFFVVTAWMAIILLSWAVAATAQEAANGFLDRKISLSVERSSIPEVLQLLARQNGFNISMAGEIDGEVTFVLKDIILRDALDAILKPSNFTWYLKNNVVMVKTSDFLSSDEIVSVVYRLKYAAAQEALQTGTPLLSKGGKLEILAEQADPKLETAPSGTIVISDRQDNIDQILKALLKLDQPAPQISIAVKLVETNLSEDNKLGIDWPESYGFSFGGIADEGSTVSSPAIRSFEEGDWIWGRFAASEVRSALDLMLRSGNSRLLSDPHLTTISNKPAEIAVTTTIPIQTLNRFTEGSIIQDIVSFQDLDVGITLKVIARINDSGFITMKVFPTIEEITGFTGPVDNQRPITAKRSMNTTVRVRDGETLVMGGLVKESEFRTTKKVPLLGSIPGIGRIFQHQSTKKEKTDLTVFITPQIMP